MSCLVLVCVVEILALIGFVRSFVRSLLFVGFTVVPSRSCCATTQKGCKLYQNNLTISV